MARKMHWTTAKTAYVVNNADKMTLDEIAASLGCSEEAVKQHAKRLRRSGRHVSLRKRLKGLRLCPTCSKRRSLFTSGGMCRVCELNEQLRVIKGRQEALLELMEPQVRASYLKSESSIGSKPLPKPRPQKTVGMTPEEKAKAAQERDRALEAWEIGCLTRKIKAAQKRKERMEKRCREQSYDTLPDQKHKENQ